MLCALAPFSAIIELIAGSVCWMALIFFRDRSSRFICTTGTALVIGAVLAALPFTLRAGRIRAVDNRQGRFEVGHPVVWRTDEITSLDFVPPDHHSYRIGLLSPRGVELPAAGDRLGVECTIEAHGRAVLTSTAPPFNGSIGWGATHMDLLGSFDASPDEDYHIRLRVRQIAEDLQLEQTQLAIFYEFSAPESERGLAAALLAANRRVLPARSLWHPGGRCDQAAVELAGRKNRRYGCQLNACEDLSHSAPCASRHRSWMLARAYEPHRRNRNGIRVPRLRPTRPAAGMTRGPRGSRTTFSRRPTSAASTCTTVTTRNPPGTAASCSTAAGCTSTWATWNTPRPSAWTCATWSPLTCAGACVAPVRARRAGSVRTGGVPQEQHRPLHGRNLRLSRELSDEAARRSSTPQSLGSLLSFLATRQIFTGAGRVGQANPLAFDFELPRSENPVDFQISQPRGPHRSTTSTSGVQFNRAIINARDEPLADYRKYRRLHLLIGDSNMSPFATALKVGTTACVLTLLEENLMPFDVILHDAVQATREILARSVPTLGGPTGERPDVRRAGHPIHVPQAGAEASGGGRTRRPTGSSSGGVSRWTPSVRSPRR